MRRLLPILLTLVAGLLLAPSVQAASPRVVALEWDAVEALSALGVTPAGIADPRGYDAFVGVPRRRGGVNVGQRQAPSLEAIRRIKPTLIIVPSTRSTSNLSQLRKIAPVLVTEPYPAGGNNSAQFNAMVRDFRRIAAAVGRKSAGEKVLANMVGEFNAAKAKVRARRVSGHGVVLAVPGGTTSSPALRLTTNNALASDVIRRIGLKNAWTGGNTRYGYTTASIGTLGRITNKQWLLFIYPEQYRKQIQSFRELKAFAKLPVVRAQRYRNLNGRTWLYGGPLSAAMIAREVSDAVGRGAYK